MFKTCGNNIYITRGDSSTLAVDILNADGTAYSMVDGDVINFTVKKHATDAAALISKSTSDSTITVTGNEASIGINPGDTKSLDYGIYLYDVQITHKDGSVDTFITPTPFSVMEEVTF
jgi:hypothetical protein